MSLRLVKSGRKRGTNMIQITKTYSYQGLREVQLGLGSSQAKLQQLIIFIAYCCSNSHVFLQIRFYRDKRRKWPHCGVAASLLVGFSSTRGGEPLKSRLCSTRLASGAVSTLAIQSRRCCLASSLFSVILPTCEFRKISMRGERSPTYSQEATT